MEGMKEPTVSIELFDLGTSTLVADIYVSDKVNESGWSITWWIGGFAALVVARIDLIQAGVLPDESDDGEDELRRIVERDARRAASQRFPGQSGSIKMRSVSKPE